MRFINAAFQSTALIIIMVLASASVNAALTASVDRDRVAMGDTIRLTIAATNDEPINNTDPRPLLRDFEILQRSSSSNTSIINGDMTSTRQLILDITPKREGSLRIPPLRVGRDETNYLLIAVGPATTAAGDPLIDFVAELDQNSVYVQGQAILILRIQQAVNLESRSVTELSLDDAFVKQLEQKTFQRTIGGRPWLVHEIRYAIFPEKSGSIEIPAQTFSARESTGRRSMFDIGSNGRQIQRNTKALTLQVLPRPDSFPAPTWLPARNVEVEESWSTPPEQLRVGESATRRITIKGEGLQGAQLPPILFPANPGLKYYPDQPVVSDGEVASGVMGSREDSAALVPTKVGTWEVPEIRIPWWDTKTRKVQYAIVPARQIVVAASLDSGTALTLPNPTTITAFDSTPIAMAPRQNSSSVWVWLALLSTLGWVLTLVYLFARKLSPATAKPVATENMSERAAYKMLIAACSGDNAAQARRHLILWAAAVFTDESIHSLDVVKSRFHNSALSDEIEKMNSALYGSAETRWNGTALIQLVKELRSRHTGETNDKTQELQLYPS
jgi:hypothetical protein